jgi:uncharacterized membrane protein YkvA (DUF1232 family)
MKSIVESFYNWYSNQIRHPKYRWFIVLGTIAYLLSPLDISPDFIPILGWIDDGVMITLLTTELSRLLIEQRKRKSGDIAETETFVNATPIEVDAKAV